MIRFILLFQLTVLSCVVFGQVAWVSFGDLPDKFSNDKKVLIIFVHTDWCKICKMQEGTVFADDSISKLINEQFYALKLNAEDENDISFFGRTYKGATSRSHHEFAEYIGKDGKTLNFPTMVILNERLEIIYKKVGFVSKEEILVLMVNC